MRNTDVAFGEVKVDPFFNGCEICQRNCKEVPVFKSVKEHLYHRITEFNVDLSNSSFNRVGRYQLIHVFIQVFCAAIDKNLGY